MKLVQLCLGSFYVDGYGYQENLLPKYQKQFVDEIKIVASLVSFNEKGKPCLLKEESEYINEHSIPVKRIAYKDKFYKLCKMLRVYKQNIYIILEEEKPDIIFVHGFQFLDVLKVKKYAKKHPQVVIYADNHADFENSASSWISKNILHKLIWKYCAKSIEPYTKKFYGVLPARVDFLTDVYGLPKEKVELLVMGADDEKVQEAKKSEARKQIREEYKINEEDFLVITGGKIDHNKPEIIDLMRVVAKRDVNVKLMVFGSVVPELQKEFEELVKRENIIYIGWIKPTEMYKYFEAAELAVFPGKHSVIWEQAVGSGIPCVFRKIKGFEHVDVGGNCVFIEDVSYEGIKNCLKQVSEDKDSYSKMRKISKENGMNSFSYKEIARKSIL